MPVTRADQSGNQLAPLFAAGSRPCLPLGKWSAAHLPALLHKGLMRALPCCAEARRMARHCARARPCDGDFFPPRRRPRAIACRATCRFRCERRRAGATWAASPRASLRTSCSGRACGGRARSLKCAAGRASASRTGPWSGCRASTTPIPEAALSVLRTRFFLKSGITTWRACLGVHYGDAHVDVSMSIDERACCATS